jgi:hypothetical protein
MLPPQHSAQDLERLRLAVEQLIDGDFFDASLSPDDVRLIGSYIRTFTFLELNLHRAVRMFFEIGALSSKDARRPAAGNLTSLVSQGALNIPLIKPELDELEIRLAEIAVGQPFRNLLAHWACGRLPQTDVFIFLTMDERDAKVMGNHRPSYDGAYFALVRQSDLRSLLKRMEVAGHWLAERVAGWHEKLFARDGNQRV